MILRIVLGGAMILCPFLIAGCQFVSESSERPNIVFIVTDDQGPWAVGMDPQAHPQLLGTPNMDRIGAEGMYFTQAFTPTPVCSPSRATLLTGQYAHEVGINDWIHPSLEPGVGLNPETVTWPEVLQRAGYETGLVGKWHLGIVSQYHPTNHGYDYFMGFLDGGNSPRDPDLEERGEKQTYKGYTQNILTDHAIEFIERNQSGPFALSLHYRAPHAPWLPLPGEDWAPYKNLARPELADPNYPNLDTAWAYRATRRYLASVSSVDRNIGRVLNTLERLGIDENTVVIFTSDHGYNITHHGLMYKGNAFWMLTDYPPATDHVPAERRPNMFDESIRVPLAIHWPGTVESGQMNRRTVSFVDFYPTILEIAGVPVPDDVPLRGRSIVPLLKGESPSEWRDVVYGEYSMHHGAHTHMRMYRTSEWKLIRDYLDRSRDELYHLTEDPGETENLLETGESHAVAVADSLGREMRSIIERTNDPVQALMDDR